MTTTLGSLYLSEILGYEPCKLCWFQRIFMYPQVFLFGVAGFVHYGRKNVFNYTFSLNLIGFLIAVYHYSLQLGVVNDVACSVVGFSASCSEYFSMDFGYITIPLMSATAFLMILVLGWLSKKTL